MRGGGAGDRSRDDEGERLGDADSGVGTASVGAADGSGTLADAGIGGTAGMGVRERAGVDGAGDLERTGVEDGVWMGSGARSVCGR